MPEFRPSGAVPPLVYSFIACAGTAFTVKVERTRCDRYARRVCRRVKTWLIEQLSPVGHSDIATLTELTGIWTCDWIEPFTYSDAARTPDLNYSAFLFPALHGSRRVAADFPVK